MEPEMLPWPEYSHFTVSLFAILTPFAAVPAYVSLTKEFTAWERSRTAILAAGTAAAVLVLTALIGGVVLRALGVSLASLRVGGGLLLLLMAHRSLCARRLEGPLSVELLSGTPLRRASAIGAFQPIMVGS
jgi:multiple antibiotic resistance protein